MTRLFDSEALFNCLDAHMKSSTEGIFVKLSQQSSLARLDELVRSMLHELGDKLIQTLLRDLGNRIRFDRDPPACACGNKRRFKQMRSMRLRSALTGKQLSVPSPYIICDHLRKAPSAMSLAGALPDLSNWSLILPYPRGMVLATSAQMHVSW